MVSRRQVGFENLVRMGWRRVQTLFWEEELDGGWEALGPGFLFMPRSGLFNEDDCRVIEGGGFEIVGELLGELDEAAVEGVRGESVVAGELDAVSYFIHAYPDGDSSRADDERRGVAEELTVADLEGGAFEQTEAEEIGPVQQGVECGDGSVGGASDGGVAGIAEDAVLAGDEREDFGGKEGGEEFAVRLGRREDRVGVGDVFVATTVARRGVDADDDERLDFVGGDEAGEGFVDLPLVVRAVGAGVEELFAVEHVENGVAFLRVDGIVVSGREPDAEGLRVAEDCAGEGFFL